MNELEQFEGRKSNEVHCRKMDPPFPSNKR